MPDVPAQDFIAGYLDGYFYESLEPWAAARLAEELLKAMAEAGLVVVQI